MAGPRASSLVRHVWRIATAAGGGYSRGVTLPQLTLYAVPSGDAGTLATLQLMRSLIRRAGPVTRQWAQRLQRGDVQATLEALRDFLVVNVMWTADPALELVQDPDTLLRQWPAIAGDCDDAAIVTAALGQALGFPAKLRAVSYTPGHPFHHVYALLRTPAGWRRFDVTRPWTAPEPRAARILELGV